ncbi:XRE family transcriptional regulator [Clostridium acetobutylicum]|nr:XRE family transcriptional regulator [Clostridium acetobutylicum]
MNTIGERLKYLRKLNNLTQKQVAEKTGVQRGNISHYEKNDFLPSRVALISFANFFKTNYDWIVYGKGAIPKSIDEVMYAKSNSIAECTTGAAVDFSKRLIFTMKYFHETIDGLCLKLNISKDIFHEILIKKNVSAFDLFKICNYFNVSMDWMFNGNITYLKSDAKLQQAYLMNSKRNKPLSYDNHGMVQCTCEEKKLLIFFESLNTKDKRLVIDILNSVNNQASMDIQKLIK